jgi:hypothetical protein
LRIKEQETRLTLHEHDDDGDDDDEIDLHSLDEGCPGQTGKKSAHHIPNFYGS